MISILTATYNSESTIEKLIDSLLNQTDQRFEWVVADGGSEDDTLDILKEYGNAINLKLLHGPDFGIYDALNKAVRESQCEFYVVIGSDDFFFESAISNFIHEIQQDDGKDIYTGKLKFGEKIRGVRKGGSLLNKQFAYVSSHSVSTLFRKSLHEKAGFYSKNYPIAADQYFILNAVNNGAKILFFDKVVGVFNKGGVSSVDVLGNLTESYRIQVKFERKYLATIVFILKLVKNFGKIK